MSKTPGSPTSARWKGLVVLPLVAGATLMASNTASAVPDPDTFIQATPPERAFDSRSGNKIPAGSFTDIEVAGFEDIPADAEAIIVNLAAVEAEAAGFLSIVPSSASQPIPTTSNLNVDGPGVTIANSAIIPIGEGGSITVYNSMTTHILVDLTGYVPAGADYSEIPLTRALDTRPNGATANTDYDVDVVGSFGDADAELVIVNITLVNSLGGGFVTAWPGGTTQPPTSNLNVDGAGQTRAGLAIVPIGADGTITVRTSIGGELLVDVLGYFGELSGFEGLDPAVRVTDTRPGRLAADSTTNVEIAGEPGIPATATFALVNVTAVQASSAGFISVWPGGLEQPNASNLNYPTGGTIANTVLVPLGADGSINIYTQSEIALLVDVIGYI